VGKTTQERAREARNAKLERIREQVASGDLVLHEMTPGERAKWAERRVLLDARLSPSERSRRDAILRERRRRAERNAAPD
jgi:hypothetical protein